MSKTYWENPHQFIKFQRKEIPEFELYSYTDGCKEMVRGQSATKGTLHLLWKQYGTGDNSG